MPSKISKLQKIVSPKISLRAIIKAFPGVLANDHINLDIYNSEVHALLGENGAGKSTLMKILYGFYRADGGEILIDGKPVQIQTPNEARLFRIGMVFQDFNLIPAFTVAENIALFLPDLKPILNMDAISRRITLLASRYDLKVDPHALVSQLSIGQQQKVEILKMLLSEAHILILDEPTRVLAPHEVEGLFRIFDHLRKDGYAIIFITHKLKEVLECADRITILRSGKVAGSLLRKKATENSLIKLMFDKEPDQLKAARKSPQSSDAHVLLEFSGVSTYAEGAAVSLKNINLKIHSGEIVGVAGVSGNGQKELGDVGLGLEKCISGTHMLMDKDATIWSVGRVRKNGVAYVPENPLAMAVAPMMTILENMILSDTWRYARQGGFTMDWKAAHRDTDQSYKKFGFPEPNLYQPARALSGGNLQRMVIAREIAHGPKLIIASYLTRGLDVISTIAARQALISARDSGAGILLISEDLEELFTLSDRLIVLYAGKIVGEFKPKDTNYYEIGHLMTGSKANHVPKN